MISLNDLKNGRGQTYYEFAKNLIPGGTQLLSKRPEMFAPDLWPAYYSKAKGCHIWDLDGNRFTDMSIMSVGACILGYADDDVDDAVVKAIRDGVSSSLNSTAEVELAETLIELHPWFDMVRYARGGGEAISIAIRIARAKTGRDNILFSGYHGWPDWYLAANLADKKGLDGQLMPGLKPSGVPRALHGTAIPFDFNDIESLKSRISGLEKSVAAIIIEPARGAHAPKEYLTALRGLADEIGAVLIFDEITSGFRICVGGIHREYRVNPDMAIFAKSMANGYAMSAILGKKEVMQAAQSTFISSTNWTDAVGPVAALATIKKYKEQKVAKHIISVGSKVKDIWKASAQKEGMSISISGLDSLAAFNFEGSFSQELSTRFVVEMLSRGFLGFKQFKPSLAHTDNELMHYEKAVADVFELLAKLPKEKILTSKLAHNGFRRLTKE